MHKYLNTTQQSVAWFKRQNDLDCLTVAPPFQRNPVWSLRQKSSLIDTILYEYPIPEIYMQEITDGDGNQQHILVDGQQRIRTVLSFVAGEFELVEEDSRWEGLGFEDLKESDRKKVFEYNFVIRMLPEMPDEEIRAIFQRLNKNTMALNTQELRHATYWGPFIKLMEEISNLDFWSTAGIFSANDRRRMLDIEYISELAIAVLNGLQNKKSKLEDFYQQYESSFDEVDKLRGIFLKVLGELEQVLPNLSKSRWKKKSDFYSLFYKLSQNVQELPLSSENRKYMATVLNQFAEEVDQLISNGGQTNESQQAVEYLNAVQRAASDLGSRKERHRVLDQILIACFI